MCASVIMFTHSGEINNKHDFDVFNSFSKIINQSYLITHKRYPI